MERESSQGKRIGVRREIRRGFRRTEMDIESAESSLSKIRQKKELQADTGEGALEASSSVPVNGHAVHQRGGRMAWEENSSFASETLTDLDVDRRSARNPYGVTSLDLKKQEAHLANQQYEPLPEAPLLKEKSPKPEISGKKRENVPTARNQEFLAFETAMQEKKDEYIKRMSAMLESEGIQSISNKLSVLTSELPHFLHVAAEFLGDDLSEEDKKTVIASLSKNILL